MKKFVGVFLSFLVMVIAVVIAGIVLAFDAIRGLSAAIVCAFADAGQWLCKKATKWIDENFEVN